jgi:predicted nucleotidyltransferase
MPVVDMLAALGKQYGVDALYAFGSRAAEVAAFVRGRGGLNPSSRSDLDVGVLPQPNRLLDVHDRVRLTGALEDLFNVPRVDLVVLPQASTYLALDAVSGELLFCADPLREAEFQLYVLRRAGDLAFFERERRQRLLTGISP